MPIEFDAAKCTATLEARGLDMAKADEVFAGATLAVEDDREDYGEDRFITIGFLDPMMVVLVLDAARRCAPDHQHEESQ